MIQLLAMAGTRFDHGVRCHWAEAEVGGEEDRDVIEYLLDVDRRHRRWWEEAQGRSCL